MFGGHRRRMIKQWPATCPACKARVQGLFGAIRRQLPCNHQTRAQIQDKHKEPMPAGVNIIYHTPRNRYMTTEKMSPEASSGSFPPLIRSAGCGLGRAMAATATAEPRRQNDCRKASINKGITRNFRRIFCAARNFISRKLLHFREIGIHCASSNLVVTLSES